MNGIEFAIHPNHELVWVRGRGSFTLERIMEHIGEVNRHPQFRPHYYSLVDFRDVELDRFHEGIEAYREFFNTHQLKAHPRKWAIFSNVQKTLDEITQVHLPTSEAILVKVFTEKGDALSWLGKPDLGC